MVDKMTYEELELYAKALERKILKLENKLSLANEDADRLATELELEQNPGCKCRALVLHYKRGEYMDVGFVG